MSAKEIEERIIFLKGCLGGCPEESDLAQDCSLFAELLSETLDDRDDSLVDFSDLAAADLSRS